MNKVLETIKERRSIRRYLEDQIKDSELDIILEAATYAPSGHNDQPWHFTVIQNKELIDSMSSKTKELMLKSNTDWIVKMAQNEKLHVLYNAPTVIVVSGKENPSKDLAYCLMADCSAAIQNMLLAAHSISIGSCWIGLTSFLFENEEEVKKLTIPEGYKPLFTVALGYSALNKEIRALKRKEDVINFIK